MERFVSGDVVVVPFPFSDNSVYLASAIAFAQILPPLSAKTSDTLVTLSNIAFLSF